MKRVLCTALILFLLPRGTLAAESGKPFFTSVIYGTLAGTLVGAATLAFTSSPGDNLNNVARGASYGLYAGILLGLYVTYSGDDEAESEEEGELEERPPVGPTTDPNGNPITPSLEDSDSRLRHKIESQWALVPLIPLTQKDPLGVGFKFNF